MKLEFSGNLNYSPLVDGSMEIRFQNSPKETSEMNTEQLRKNFLLQNLMKDDELQLVYSHYDRAVIGGVKPINKSIPLPNHPELRADYFLERRELGIINVGGPGIVIASKKEFTINKLDCVYLGKGTNEVKFKSRSKKDPALFYLLSAPAHHRYPSKLMTKEKASPVKLGDASSSNKRTIYKYIHSDGIKAAS